MIKNEQKKIDILFNNPEHQEMYEKLPDDYKDSLKDWIKKTDEKDKEIPIISGKTSKDNEMIKIKKNEFELKNYDSLFSEFRIMSENILNEQASLRSEIYALKKNADGISGRILDQLLVNCRLALSDISEINKPCRDIVEQKDKIILHLNELRKLDKLDEERQILYSIYDSYYIFAQQMLSAVKPLSLAIGQMEEQIRKYSKNFRVREDTE